MAEQSSKSRRESGAGRTVSLGSAPRQGLGVRAQREFSLPVLPQWPQVSEDSRRDAVPCGPKTWSKKSQDEDAEKREWGKAEGWEIAKGRGVRRGLERMQGGKGEKQEAGEGQRAGVGAGEREE